MSDRFAHHLRVDQIHDGERLDLVADEAERDAIAQRLGIESLSCLEAHAVFSRNHEIIRAQGRLAASLEQNCVVTSAPVAAHIDDPFDLVFMPEPKDIGPDDEIELGEADCDVVFYDGAIIDLGTAVADTLALSLDPYPRSAGADAALKEAGMLSETEASPFAVLEKLKRNDEA